MSKCPVCNGKGYYEVKSSYGVERVECGCHDTQTNEEWLKGLSTKRMANFLSRVTQKCNDCGYDTMGDLDVKCPYNCGFCNKNAVEEWLKAVHK